VSQEDIRTSEAVGVMSRVVVWFSAGAASAVATQLTLKEFGHERTEIVYTDPGNEHPDNRRFLADCAAWFDHSVKFLRDDRYKDAWDLWEKDKYLVGPQGARCSLVLKKRQRQNFEDPTDIQVFGYTAEEVARAERFRQQNPDVNLKTPLIERGLTKKDCLGIIDQAGIRLPAMYALGYQNNNCIGCVKGGMGYWNKIRRDFPDTFDRMAKLERKLGISILRANGKKVWLDELDPNRGRYEDENEVECSLLCGATANEIAL